MSSMIADGELVRARRVMLGTAPESPARLVKAWAGLEGALETYDAAVAASSLSSEGVSRSIDVSAAAQEVKHWLLVYDAELADAAEPEVVPDPVTMREPMGHTFDHSGVWLR